MSADCSFFRSSMAFPVCTPFCSANGSGLLNIPVIDVYYRRPVRVPYSSVDGSGLLILALVNGLYDGFRTELLSRWLGRSLIHSLVNGFHDGLRAVLLSGWQRIAHTSARQWLSRRFSRRVDKRMAADCSYFCSSMALPSVSAPYCSADGSELLILPSVNGFHDGSCTVWLSGWHQIAHTSARQQLSQQFARCIAQRMAADCSHLRSSTAFPTVRAPYRSEDSSVLLILPLVNGFHSLRAVFLSEWQRIAHSSARRQLSRRVACRFTQRMAAHWSLSRLLTAFITGCTPSYSANGSVSLVLPLVNVCRCLRAVLLSGWQRIAQSSARRWLSRRFTRHLTQRMAAHCPYFCSSTAFTVCAPFCSVDGSGLLILPLVNGFHDSLRAALASGWHRIAHTSARQRLSRWFARHIAQWMASYCSLLYSSTAFTMVCAPYCSADGSGLLTPPLVNGFHDGLRSVSVSGWQRIAHSSARRRLSRWFARRIAQRMAADCTFFRSSTAFTTVCAPYWPVDGIGLLTPTLVNGFHGGLRAVLLSGWHHIAHTSARQRLLRRFVRRIAQRMAADCSHLRLSTAFTMVCAPYRSADVSRLLILPLVNGFHDGLRAVTLSGWQRIAHTSACQRLLRRFAHRIGRRMAVDCSFFRSSTALTTVCVPYCSADGIGLPPPPLVNGFHDGLRAVLLSGGQCIAHTSAHQWLTRQFAQRITLRMAANCSFFCSPMAFTVCAPFCADDGSGLLILPFVNGFHNSLRTVFLRGWQRIARSSSRQCLSRFARHFAQRISAHCSFFR